jgi:hypothetical protein
MAHHRRVRRETDVGGIDAEQDVMHAGVADDDDLVDPLREHAGVAADLLDVLVEEAEDPSLELSQVARVELREGDARHEVAAEDSLGVEARQRRELLARLELEERRHHAGRADVDREAELHPGGVAALDRENPLATAGRERRHGDARGVVAKGLRQSLENRGTDVGGREADRFQELLEIGRLVMLLARQRDLDDLLGDTGIERDPAELPHVGPGAQHLERPLLERRRDLDGHGLVEDALAGEAIALTDEVVAELDLVHDRRRRRQTGQELDPARGAPSAPAARRGDVHAARVRRLQNRGPGRDAERPARRGAAGSEDDRQRDGHGPSF